MHPRKPMNDFLSSMVTWEGIDDPVVLQHKDKCGTGFLRREITGGYGWPVSMVSTSSSSSSSGDGSSGGASLAVPYPSKSFAPSIVAANDAAVQNLSNTMYRAHKPHLDEATARHMVAVLQSIKCYRSVGIFWIADGFSHFSGAAAAASSNPNNNEDAASSALQPTSGTSSSASASAPSVQRVLDLFHTVGILGKPTPFYAYVNQTELHSAAAEFSSVGATLRPDVNQDEQLTLDALSAIGVSVMPTHQLSSTYPDVLCLFLGNRPRRALSLLTELRNRSQRTVVVVEDSCWNELKHAIEKAASRGGGGGVRLPRESEDDMAAIMSSTWVMRWPTDFVKGAPGSGGAASLGIDVAALVPSSLTGLSPSTSSAGGASSNKASSTKVPLSLPAKGEDKTTSSPTSSATDAQPGVNLNAAPFVPQPPPGATTSGATSGITIGLPHHHHHQYPVVGGPGGLAMHHHHHAAGGGIFVGGFSHHSHPYAHPPPPPPPPVVVGSGNLSAVKPIIAGSGAGGGNSPSNLTSSSSSSSKLNDAANNASSGGGGAAAAEGGGGDSSKSVLSSSNSPPISSRSSDAGSSSISDAATLAAVAASSSSASLSSALKKDVPPDAIKELIQCVRTSGFVDPNNFGPGHRSRALCSFVGERFRKHAASFNTSFRQATEAAVAQGLLTQGGNGPSEWVEIS